MSESNGEVMVDDNVVSTAKPITEMTDREIAEETLTHLRNVGTFVLQFQGMSPAQLIKAMLTGGK